MAIYTKKRCSSCNVLKVVTDFEPTVMKQGVQQYAKVCDECKQQKNAAKAKNTTATVVTEETVDEMVKQLETGLIVCRVCGESKPLSEYYKDRVANGIQRYRTDCKACSKKESKGRTKKYNEQKGQLVNDLTDKQWLEACNYFEHACAYCGEYAIEDQDHVVPVKDGGGYTVSNILPSCHRCNASKGTKNMVKWLATMPWYSAERLQKIVNYLKQFSKSS